MSDFPGEAWLLNWIRERFPRLAQPDLGLGALLKPVSGSTLAFAFGESAVTFTASGTSAAVTISHGLGKTPVLIAVFNRAPAVERVVYIPDSEDETDFVYRGYTSAATVVTATQNTYWVAVA